MYCTHRWGHTNTSESAHTSSQRVKYIYFPLLWRNRNLLGLFYQHGKRKRYSFAFLVCALLRGFCCGSPPEARSHKHARAPTQTQNQALFALEGVSLTLWEIKWHALLAGLFSARWNCGIWKNGVIFTWVSSSKEDWLNKQRNLASLVVLRI